MFSLQTVISGFLTHLRSPDSYSMAMEYRLERKTIEAESMGGKG